MLPEFLLGIETRQSRRDKQPARGHRALLSSDVAEVANRPKKRPGRRERSSITTRRHSLLVESRTIPNL
jgi:hypothetical protein